MTESSEQQNLTRLRQGSNMTRFISKFVHEETISAAIELGLLTALIAVVSLSAITVLGIKLSAPAEAPAAASSQ